MNILIFGIPLREGMAGSVRVRNLLYPMLDNTAVSLNNLYFALQADRIDDRDRADELKIDLDFKNPLSIISYLYKSVIFINHKFISKENNIFYLYEAPDIKTIIPLLYAKLLGYKIVLDIVEDNSQAASFGGFVNKLRIQSGSFILKNFQSFIDLNIVISSHLESLLLTYTSRNKVLFIPVTMDISKFEKSEFMEKPVITLFYGGSFGKKDGLDLLLEAFEEVCEEYDTLRLVLTGKGENVEDFIKFMTLVRASKFLNRITYKGFVPSGEYQELLNSCDIFCVTRDNSGAANTGFPSKLAEYLATGRAVIVTNVGDVSNYLIDRENALLVRPMDLSSLVEAIKYLIEHPEQINQIGSKGRIVAINRFNNRTESKKLFTVLNKSN
ncbi:glycosyltransferase [Algoriphagus antarcticus]|uniref:Glycosyltransferase involved in cell wall biosynthesis n=1 Tax=Algoriphagus antarcticus TaxID=238540 RepID=A0A3E0DFL3_9BACT|nr:glycosyltransferase [Algoriphagus antarcticus]REG81416.1 glycosyltransferase involved in cell wall biosynthesis [Algoriphagus antarcticus]